jgi:hypothetical protein
VKTAGELNTTGLPDASGSTILPKECVRRVERKPDRILKVVQSGEPAPSNVTTLYAVWGSYTSTSGSMSMNGTGCYIRKQCDGTFCFCIRIERPVACPQRFDPRSLTAKGSSNVTILLRNENQIGSMGIQGSNQTIRLSPQVRGTSTLFQVRSGASVVYR